jgi:hypothetical protein
MSVKSITHGIGAMSRNAARYAKTSALRTSGALCLLHPYSGDPIQLVAATVAFVLARGIERTIAVIPTRQHQRRMPVFVGNRRAAQR